MYVENSPLANSDADSNRLAAWDVLPTLHDECLSLPNSWEEFLAIVDFSDPRLVAFVDLFKNFYHVQQEKKDPTISHMMDEAFAQIYKLHGSDDAYEIARYYVFVTVLTQHNEVLGSNNRDQTVRKKEKDSEGEPYPTIKHTTEVFLNGLTIDGEPVDPATAMTLKGHDLYEDCGMYVRNAQLESTAEWIGKETLLEITSNEFKYGKDVAMALVGMSKYDQTPHMIEEASIHSLLYSCLDDSITSAYKKEGKLDNLYMEPKLWEKHHEDIMKTITSILRLRYESYLEFEQTGDREQYLTSIVRNLYSKCVDIAANLPDVSYAGKLRARLMATLARVLQLDISNSIMHKLALSTEDALFDNLQNKPLAEKLNETDFRKKKNQQLEKYFEDHFGMLVKANIGYRISFIDEAESAKDDPYAAFQTIVEVSSNDYDNLIEQFKVKLNSPDMQAFVEGDGELEAEEFSGVLQRIIHVLGRKNCMYEIKDRTKAVKHYIRIIEKSEDKPYMWERILLNRPERVASPEDKFFSPPLDSTKAVQKLLNMQLMLFNAEYFKDKNIASLVWKDGVTTCASMQEVHELCDQLGLTEGEYEFIELMDEGKKIDWQSNPNYPFCYAKLRANSEANQSGDLSQ